MLFRNIWGLVNPDQFYSINHDPKWFQVFSLLELKKIISNCFKSFVKCEYKIREHFKLLKAPNCLDGLESKTTKNLHLECSKYDRKLSNKEPSQIEVKQKILIFQISFG
jgi:hypothetical protein